MVLRNEQDVREEIATPFLKALGYATGTSNDIERERKLRYDAMQLGRKKPNDMPLPLGGNADYVLSVAGSGRWVLETKPPDQEITPDDIDQAASYARHPEIAGYYAAVLNGRQFVLHFATQTSNDIPLTRLDVTSPEELARSLEGLLSPPAIRRDCRLPVVDLRTPLAPGYRGEVAIVGGWNVHRSVRAQSQPPIPAVTTAFEETYGKVVGMRSTVKGGKIWRDEIGRIRARVAWHAPHEDMKPMLDAAQLDAFEYVCLGERISTDSAAPSVFDILGSFELRAGQPVYDLLSWKTKINGIDATAVLQGQATGFLEDGAFIGFAGYRGTVTATGLPIRMIIQFLTEFCFIGEKQ